MAFRKAKSEQAFIKMGLYGSTGSGKTFTALLLAEGLAAHCGKRIAYIDTEAGTDFYAEEISERAIHPKAFDFDRVVTKSLAQSLQEVKGLDVSVYGVVVIDSITHLWDAAIESYSGPKTGADTIPFNAWGKIKKPYKELITLLLNGQFHVLICGRQKNVFGDDTETGETRLLGVAMKAEGETPYEPHVLIRMMRQLGQGSKLAPVSAFVEKDRTGILAGQTVTLPADAQTSHTFDKLGVPFLSVLTGGEQAQIDSVDEAAAHDAERREAAETAKRRESERLHREFKAQFDLASTAEQVDEISRSITAAIKKTMLTKHVTSLRQYYTQSMDRVRGGA